MNQKIAVFILSLKNSERLPKLIRRLKVINIKYKILLGVNGNLEKNHKLLLKFYDKRETEKYIGRNLAFPEIAASLAHINAYKLIIKNKIKSAIIIEDDVYPSKTLALWIKNNINIKDNNINSFYTYPSLGFIEKKPLIKVMNDKIGIHQAKTHLHNSSCYQINLSTCKKIIQLTKGKVCGVGDWPFNIEKSGIKLNVTIPYLISFNNYKSNTEKERSKLTIDSFKIKKILPMFLNTTLRTLYYLSFYPYLIKKYKNIDFYKEQFFNKYLELIKNFFTKKYYNTNKMFLKKKFYVSDLYKKVEKLN
jgi:GR25 family glycosyltransferase involved in LPS biosynthesis